MAMAMMARQVRVSHFGVTAGPGRSNAIQASESGSKTMVRRPMSPGFAMYCGTTWTNVQKM